MNAVAGLSRQLPGSANAQAKPTQRRLRRAIIMLLALRCAHISD